MNRFLALGCLALALPAAAQPGAPEPYAGGPGGYAPQYGAERAIPYGGISSPAPVGAPESRYGGTTPYGKSSPGYGGGSGSTPGYGSSYGTGPGSSGAPGFGSSPGFGGSPGYGGGSPGYGAAAPGFTPSYGGPGYGGGAGPGYAPGGSGFGNPQPGEFAGGPGFDAPRGGYSGNPGYGGPSGSWGQGAAAYPSPGDTLQLGIQKLTSWLTAHPKAPPAELRAWLDREVSPLIDFDTMTRWALGPMNRSLEAQQYGRVRDAIQGMFLDSMARQLAGYAVGSINYLRPRGNPQEGEVVLGIQVGRTDGYPLELQFRMHEGPFGWRVIDVEAEGASAVRYYRQLLSELSGRFGVSGMVERVGR